MRIIMTTLAIACVSSPVCVAQTATPMVVGGQQTTLTLRSGTSVPLRTLEPLTTEGKKLKVGHRFKLEVSEPVVLDGQTVIPVGSPAVAEVIDVRNKGMWGKSGRIGVRVLYTDVNGRRVRLTGTTDDKGVTGTAGVVGALVLVPVAGFFMTGTSARIPVGSNVAAFTDEDVPVTFAGSSPSAPIVVAPVAAPALSSVSVVTEPK